MILRYKINFRQSWYRKHGSETNMIIQDGPSLWGRESSKHTKLKSSQQNSNILFNGIL